MTALIHTVSVITTAALGAADHAEVSAALRSRRLEFMLKAAASQDSPKLPDAQWYDGGRQMAVQTRSEDGRLELSFQAQGYEAMRRWAKRGVRLLARHRGTIVVDQHFRFSADGRGTLVLADTANVRESLASFELLADRDA